MRKCIIVATVLTGLFFPVRVCLASEPGTVIQLSMGMVIIGGAVLFGGGSLSFKKLARKRKTKTKKGTS